MLARKIADRSACLCRVEGRRSLPDEIANERSQCLAGYGSFPHQNRELEAPATFQSQARGNKMGANRGVWSYLLT